MGVRGDVDRLRAALGADDPGVCRACGLDVTAVRVFRLFPTDGPGPDEGEVDRLLATLPHCELCGLLLPPARTVNVDDDGRPYFEKNWSEGFAPYHMGGTVQANRVYAPAREEPEHEPAF